MNSTKGQRQIIEKSVILSCTSNRQIKLKGMMSDAWYWSDEILST